MIPFRFKTVQANEPRLAVVTQRSPSQQQNSTAVTSDKRKIMEKTRRHSDLKNYLKKRRENNPQSEFSRLEY